MFTKMIKGIHEAALELDNKPELYKIVGKLKIALKYEMENKRVSSREVHQSVKQLYATLRDAMQKFDDNTPPTKPCTIIEYHLHLQKFSKECHSAIFAYQPSLMSAPGLWNRIKAYINNFLEQYLGVDPIFDTEKSELCIKSGDFSNKFFAAKNAVKPRADDEESLCCISF